VPATKARCRSGVPTAGSGVGSVASSALLVGSHSVAVSPAAAASSEPSALQAAASIGSPAQRHRSYFRLMPVQCDGLVMDCKPVQSSAVTALQCRGVSSNSATTKSKI